MALTTTCPTCNTQFKIVPDLLRVHHGLVRCGNCSFVYDANTTLVHSADEAPELPPPAAPTAASDWSNKPAVQALLSGNGGKSNLTDLNADTAVPGSLTDDAAHKAANKAAHAAKPSKFAKKPALDTQTLNVQAFDVQNGTHNPSHYADTSPLIEVTDSTETESVSVSQPLAANTRHAEASPRSLLRKRVASVVPSRANALNTALSQAEPDTLLFHSLLFVDDEASTEGEASSVKNQNTADALDFEQALAQEQALARRRARKKRYLEQKAEAQALAIENGSDASLDTGTAISSVNPVNGLSRGLGVLAGLKLAKNIDKGTNKNTNKSTDKTTDRTNDKAQQALLIPSQFDTQNVQFDTTIAPPSQGGGVGLKQASSLKSGEHAHNLELAKNTDSAEFAVKARVLQKISPLLWSMSLLAGIALLVQLALAYRHWIVNQVPALKPAFEAACEPLGCTLEPVQWVGVLNLDALSVSRMGNASAGGAPYQLQATLRNTSSLQVQVPALELSLSNPTGELVARKTIDLSELTAANAVLQPHSDLQLDAVLMLSADTAGYTGRLVYPSPKINTSPKP